MAANDANLTETRRQDTTDPVSASDPTPVSHESHESPETVPDTASPAAPSNKKLFKYGFLALLAVALFFGGWIIGYRRVTEMEETLATERASFESDLEAAQSAQTQAEAAQAAAESQVAILTARQGLSRSALALSEENFGQAREHLRNAVNLMESAPQPFAALAAEGSQIDIQAGPDATAAQEAIQRLAASLDAALDAE